MCTEVRARNLLGGRFFAQRRRPATPILKFCIRAWGRPAPTATVSTSDRTRSDRFPSGRLPRPNPDPVAAGRVLAPPKFADQLGFLPQAGLSEPLSTMADRESVTDGGGHRPW